MLRALLVLLLLANGLFFAWTRGWLGAPPHAAEREPARLAAQTGLERVRVLPPERARNAEAALREAERVCVEIGPLVEPALSEAEFRLAEALVAPFDVERRDTGAEGWMLRVPGASPAQAGRLRRPEAGFRDCGAGSPPDAAAAASASASPATPAASR